MPTATIAENATLPSALDQRLRSSASHDVEDGNANLRRLLLIAAGGITIALVPFASGLIGSLMLCTLLRPAHRRLAPRLGVRFSAALLAVVTLIVVLIPGAWLFSTIVDEASGMLASFDANAALERLSHTRFGSVDVSIDLSRDVTSLVTTLLSWLSGHAASVVGVVTSAILNVLIALFGLYYLLLNGDGVWAHARRFLPVSEHTSDALASRFVDVTDALLLGTLSTALLQGTLVGVAFSIVGLRPAIVWGFVTACASILPLVGSALVWLPGAIVLITQGRVGAAVFVAIVGAALVSNIDNLTRPFVYRRVSGIHPMLTLVGAFAGVRLFGLIGAFLGPLVLSYFVELVDVYDVARPSRTREC